MASRLVPHLAAARLTEIGRPLAGRHAVRVLAEQMVAARDDGERPLVALLAQIGVDRSQPQQPLRVVAEHVLQVGFVQPEPVGRVEDGAHLLEADLDRLPEEGAVVPLELVGGDPGEPGAERDRAPALVRDRKIGAVHQLTRPELVHDRDHGLRLADGGGVEPYVLQPAQGGDPPGGVGAVKAARRVREDELRVRKALALLADLPLVLRIVQRRIAHDVQHDEPAALIGDLPRPVGQELVDVRLLRVLAGAVAVVALEAADPLTVEIRFHLGKRRVRGDQVGADRGRVARGLRRDVIVFRADRQVRGRKRQDQGACHPLGAAELRADQLPPFGQTDPLRSQLEHRAQPRKVLDVIEMHVGVEDALGDARRQLGRCLPVLLGGGPAGLQPFAGQHASLLVDQYKSYHDGLTKTRRI